MKLKKIFRVGLLAVAATLIFTANAIGGEVVNLLPDFFIGGGAILADAFAGAAETTQGTATEAAKPAHNKSSVDSVLHKIMPSQFPMDEMLRKLSTAKTDSTKYEYFKVRARGVSALVAVDVEPSSSTPDIATITVSSAHIFSQDGNILVPSWEATGVGVPAKAAATGVSFSPLVLHICSVDRATNKIVVKALNASAVPAIKGNTVLFRMGTAKNELAAISEDPMSQPAKDYNFCQIHMTTVSEGVYQKLQEKEVQYGLAEFKEQALYDFRMTNEIDALFGVAREFDDIEGRHKYTSDGLVRKITKKIEKGNTVPSVTEDILMGWAADIFDGNNGSDTRILYYGTEFGKAIANCRTIYKSLEAGKTEVKFGLTFNRIETNFGTLLLKYHSLLNRYGYGSAAIVVDPANVYRCIQKPLEATELNLDKSGQKRSKDIRIDESHTLAVTNPETHAIILA